jgi:hypothetical protein
MRVAIFSSNFKRCLTAIPASLVEGGILSVGTVCRPEELSKFSFEPGYTAAVGAPPLASEI